MASASDTASVVSFLSSISFFFFFFLVLLAVFVRVYTCVVLLQTDAALSRGAVFEVTYSQAIQSELPYVAGVCCVCGLCM